MSKKNQVICPRCAVGMLANIDAILPENIGWGISMSLGFDKINITVAITDPESGVGVGRHNSFLGSFYK
jgi:hypothetical protein